VGWGKGSKKGKNGEVDNSMIQRGENETGGKSPKEAKEILTGVSVHQKRERRTNGGSVEQGRKTGR